jgi:hypothetical protein
MSEKTKLNEFISRVKKHGLLTTTHFYIIIPDFGGGRDALMFCDSANLPGLTLMTTEVRTFGELSTMPHAPMYQNIQLTFICDSTMDVKNAIESWMSQVFDRQNRQINYYDNYTKNVEIYLTDKAGNNAYKVTLFEAYPIAMGDIQLDYSAEGIVKVPVTLTYKWWESSFYGNKYQEEFLPFKPQTSVQMPSFLGSLQPGKIHY